MQDLERLERARAHVVTAAAVPDPAANLGALNVAYGLAKIQCVQEALGYPADATFVASVDLTTPRQATRWQWGLAMGGLLSWGEGDRPLVFLDLQLGTSTTLVGGLAEPPELARVVSTAHRLHSSPPVVMGVRADWDYAGGNHFINAYAVHSTRGERLPPYVFVLHGGGSDVKKPSPLGTGLDYQVSPPLRDQMTTVATPFGPAHVVTCAAARDYHALFQRCVRFSKEKQLVAGSELFGRFSTVSHTIHHGLHDLNGALLGCSRFEDGERTLFPVTLRHDLPAVLVRGTPSLDPELLAGLPLSDAARGRALRANLLPHGGGYAYPNVKGVRDVLSVEGTRYYLLESAGRG